MTVLEWLFIRVLAQPRSSFDFFLTKTNQLSNYSARVAMRSVDTNRFLAYRHIT